MLGMADRMSCCSRAASRGSSREKKWIRKSSCALRAVWRTELRHERRHQAPGAQLPGDDKAQRSNWLVDLFVEYRSIGVLLVLVIVVVLTSIDNYRFVSVTSLQQLVSGPR